VPELQTRIDVDVASCHCGVFGQLRARV
jgi:hypothetical protein